MDRKSRAELERAKEWENPDALWIPPAFMERMKAAGNTVKWLRYTEGDDKPDRRLPQRLHQGWRFVVPEECPEWEHPPTVEHARFKSLISVGDVALAICPEHVDRRNQELSEKRARDQAQAVRNNLLQNRDAFSEKMPIYDNSTTHTTTGRRPTKFGD